MTDEENDDDDDDTDNVSVFVGAVLLLAVLL
jgi:hypothetical protein